MKPRIEKLCDPEYCVEFSLWNLAQIRHALSVKVEYTDCIQKEKKKKKKKQHTTTVQNVHDQRSKQIAEG